MKINHALLLAFFGCSLLRAQNVMTPDLLWQVKKVSPIGISTDGESLVYKVSSPNMAENTFDTKYYKWLFHLGRL